MGGQIVLTGRVYSYILNATAWNMGMPLGIEYIQMKMMCSTFNDNPTQQSSHATVSRLAMRNRISPPCIMSYLLFSYTLPNITFWSSVEIWLLILVKKKILNSVYISRQTEIVNISRGPVRMSRKGNSMELLRNE